VEYGLRGPWLHIIPTDHSELANEILAPAPGMCIRRLRGEKMSNESRLFDEVSAACQFPYYFGENWDALSECLNDLSWMPADSYVLVVSNACLVLADDRLGFDTFVRILSDTGRHWSEFHEDTRPWAPDPHAFHVAMQVESEDAAFRLSNRLVRAGATFEFQGRVVEARAC
jgi:hypothetical protein